jgi:hypothetical protein
MDDALLAQCIRVRGAARSVKEGKIGRSMLMSWPISNGGLQADRQPKK